MDCVLVVIIAEVSLGWAEPHFVSCYGLSWASEFHDIPTPCYFHIPHLENSPSIQSESIKAWNPWLIWVICYVIGVAGEILAPGENDWDEMDTALSCPVKTHHFKCTWLCSSAVCRNEVDSSEDSCFMFYHWQPWDEEYVHEVARHIQETWVSSVGTHHAPWPVFDESWSVIQSISVWPWGHFKIEHALIVRCSQYLSCVWTALGHSQ